MIIAWAFFILGIIMLCLSISVIIWQEKVGRNFNKFTLFGFTSAVLSAQYIWG